MSSIQIRDVPPAVHAELRRRAEAAGVSIRGYLLDLIRRELERPTMDDWIGRIEARRSVSLDAPVEDLVAGDRSTRFDDA